ncbi:aminotransferase class I/II-fold pyridoxal phosphate-dependent enzyme [Acidithiobacillus ferriphilus]|uniref:aminotransferase class I/II-fold pyridoxal phosphate-dependent enzyme n=1 Tax=Acidithiobacillus ferriphilus TaxID=1689834 RepID=UPI00390C915A
MNKPHRRSLAAQVKEQLIQKGLEMRLKQMDAAPATRPRQEDAAVPEAFTRFDQQPGFRQVRMMQEGARRFGVENPFFHVHAGTAAAHSEIAGHPVINYGSYNYLGLSGHPRVNAAAKAAIDRYGTSVSASRIVAGERPLHRNLEQSIAELYGVDDALVMVSGHGTNISLIGHLLGPKDIVLHDEYAHNSILMGIQISRAQRFSFRHNDIADLEQLLQKHRHRAERLLIAVEGIYSMDGDYPDLPSLIHLKKRYGAWLLIDEAHALGVVGQRGLGIAEHFGIDPREVDIWMGTLSKSLAACGGYVAGEKALIENLRYLAPGFLYSVGMSPPVAAAAQAALDLLKAEPERVATLQARGAYFFDRIRALGLDTRSSAGIAIIPVIFGSSLHAVRLSSELLRRGVHVQPIIYPAVPEKQARLRFFLSSTHSQADIDITLDALRACL